jgi:hypothetical protein
MREDAMSRRRNLLRQCVLLTCVLGGCSMTGPNCLVTDDARVIGTWGYAGGTDPSMRSVPADQLGRPQGIEFHGDRTFVARFPATPEGDPANPIRYIPGGDVDGHWSAGRYCVESLFIPRTYISTTPRLPNAVDVAIIGDRLIILGADSGINDAAYRRAAVAAPPSDAP